MKKKNFVISLPLDTALEYKKQLELTFDVTIEIYTTNNWASLYTIGILPPEGKK